MYIKTVCRCFREIQNREREIGYTGVEGGGGIFYCRGGVRVGLGKALLIK